ncbi:MAG: hypothetical protein ABI199_07315 [Bacteroidia bacterium]
MKKLSLRKIIFLTVIIALILFFGYLRDFIFIHTNREIGIQYYKMANDDLPTSLRWMKNFNYLQLIKFKWLFTFLFSGIFLLITLLVTKLLFDKKNFLKISLYAYIAVFSIALVFTGCGYLIPIFRENGYELSRYFMHIAQSPLIMMVLIPAFKLSEKK